MNSKLIKKLEKIALSNTDVLDLVNHKANFITYDKLAHSKHIDDILGSYGACIILFLTREKFGHFCCIFKIDKNELHFFDPYGYMPDEQLDFEIDKNTRKKRHEDFTYLLWLLLNSGYKVTYNEIQFQQDSANVSTCGRHCAIRLLLRNLNEDEYKKIIKRTKINPDILVTILTYYLSNHII